MKNKSSVLIILIFAFLFSGCKNLFNNIDSGNSSNHTVRVLINQSNSRAIALPSTPTIAGYDINASGDSLTTKNYTFPNNASGYELDLGNGNWTIEVVGYKTEDSGTYKDPVVYSKTVVLVSASTTTVTLTTDLITEKVDGVLSGVILLGTAKVTVDLGTSRDFNVDVSIKCCTNDTTNERSHISKEVNIQNNKTSIETIIGSLSVGKHDLVFAARESLNSNQGFIYVKTIYIAHNVETLVTLDLSGETFTTTDSASLREINLYKKNDTTDLVAFNSSNTTFSCTGVMPEDIYQLVLKMGTPAQSIVVKTKKYGEADFSTTDVPNPTAAFIDAAVDCAQVLTYEFPAGKIISASGDSEVSIIVSKGGGTTKTYTLKLSGLAFDPEVSVISHPAVLPATALPVPITSLSAADSYLITTEEQLRALATYVNGGNGDYTAGKLFVLGNDIKLTSEWVPIADGAATHYFKGTFDGNNYKISDLSITNYYENAGFFGCIIDATVKNLEVDGSIAISTDQKCYAGGITAIIGRGSDSSTIKNCIANVNINNSTTSTSRAAGGITGCVDIGTFVIEDCLNFGNIEAPDYVCGIVGLNMADPIDLINCANYGTLTATAYYAAGLIYCEHNYNINISNCFNNGAVTVPTGKKSAGVYLVTASPNDKTTASSSFYNSTCVASGHYADGSSADTGTVSSYTKETDKCTLATAVNGTTDVVTALNKYTGIGTTYNKWTYSADATYKGLPVFADTVARLKVVPGVVEAVVHKPTDSYAKVSTLAVAPTTGTYAVSTLADITTINSFVTAGNSMDNVTFIMSNSIDMTGAVRIGSNEKPFSGTFDGNNYEMYNISQSSASYNGVFSSAANSKIENLTLSGTINSYTYSAAFVGYATGKVEINNCINKVTLKGTKYDGGFIGYLNSGAEVEIYNCLNLGEIDCNDNYNGSFVGYTGANTTVKISNSANYANVKCKNYAGGIIGYANTPCTLQNVISYGDVSCTSGTNKDIIGNCSTLATPYNITVTSKVYHKQSYTSIISTSEAFNVDAGVYKISDNSDLLDLLNTNLPAGYNPWYYEEVELGSPAVSTKILNCHKKN